MGAPEDLASVWKEWRYLERAPARAAQLFSGINDPDDLAKWRSDLEERLEGQGAKVPRALEVACEYHALSLALQDGDSEYALGFFNELTETSEGFSGLQNAAEYMNAEDLASCDLSYFHESLKRGYPLTPSQMDKVAFRRFAPGMSRERRKYLSCDTIVVIAPTEEGAFGVQVLQDQYGITNRINDNWSYLRLQGAQVWLPQLATEDLPRANRVHDYLSPELLRSLPAWLHDLSIESIEDKDYEPGMFNDCYGVRDACERDSELVKDMDGYVPALLRDLREMGARRLSVIHARSSLFADYLLARVEPAWARHVVCRMARLHKNTRERLPLGGMSIGAVPIYTDDFIGDEEDDCSDDDEGDIHSHV